MVKQLADLMDKIEQTFKTASDAQFACGEWSADSDETYSEVSERSAQAARVHLTAIQEALDHAFARGRQDMTGRG